MKDIVKVLPKLLLELADGFCLSLALVVLVACLWQLFSGRCVVFNFNHAGENLIEAVVFSIVVVLGFVRVVRSVLQLADDSKPRHQESSERDSA